MEIKVYGKREDKFKQDATIQSFRENIQAQIPHT